MTCMLMWLSFLWANNKVYIAKLTIMRESCLQFITVKPDVLLQTTMQHSAAILVFWLTVCLEQFANWNSNLLCEVAIYILTSSGFHFLWNIGASYILHAIEVIPALLSKRDKIIALLTLALLTVLVCLVNRLREISDRLSSQRKTESQICFGKLRYKRFQLSQQTQQVMASEWENNCCLDLL